MVELPARNGADGSEDEDDSSASQSSSSSATSEPDDVVSGTPGVSDRADRAAGGGYTEETESSGSSSTGSSSSSTSGTGSGTDDVVSGTPGVEDRADQAADEGADDGPTDTSQSTESSGQRTPTRTERKYRQVAENTPQASVATQQGVEEGDGNVARQARDLEQQVLKENEVLDDSSQVAVRREDGRLVAEPTRAGEQKIDLQARQEVRESVASDMENVDAEDLWVSEENGQYRVSVREDAQRDILAEQFEEQNPNLERGEDYELQRTEDGYQVALTEDGRQQVEAQRTETSEDPLSDVEPIDAENSGTTQSTRTDIAPEGMAKDEGPGSEMLNRLNRNENLAGSVEDVGDIEVMINGRRLESVFNEGTKRWDDASAYVGERAGDVGGIVDDAGQTEVPLTGTSAYEAAGVETNDQGEGPVESGTEAVVAGVGRATNPYAIGSASKEIAEAGVYVGSAAISGAPRETLDRTETVVNQAGVAGGLAAEYAAKNPVETAGTLVGGYFTGTAFNRATQAATRGRAGSAEVARIEARRNVGRSDLPGERPDPYVNLDYSQTLRSQVSRTRSSRSARSSASGSSRSSGGRRTAADLFSDDRGQLQMSGQRRQSSSSRTGRMDVDDSPSGGSEPSSRELLEDGPRDRASTELQEDLLRQRRQGPSTDELEPSRRYEAEQDQPTATFNPEEAGGRSRAGGANERLSRAQRSSFEGSDGLDASSRVFSIPRSSATSAVGSLLASEQRDRLDTATAQEVDSRQDVGQEPQTETATRPDSAVRLDPDVRQELRSRTDQETALRSTTETRSQFRSRSSSTRSSRTSSSTGPGSRPRRGTPRRPRRDPDIPFPRTETDRSDSSSTQFESADARWETQFADADDLADDLFGGGG
jgi:hypothetical protein